MIECRSYIRSCLVTLVSCSGAPVDFSELRRRLVTNNKLLERTFTTMSAAFDFDLWGLAVLLALLWLLLLLLVLWCLYKKYRG